MLAKFEWFVELFVKFDGVFSGFLKLGDCSFQTERNVIYQELSVLLLLISSSLGSKKRIKMILLLFPA